ncbi:Chaperone protein DnaJ [Pyrenophora tritici-repentis]|uniref:DnaJ domain containing protein n=1 Tax=Pyrenophora tritici-repentis TaxID=45151 RepID=A0A922NH88_9PLEO|nr:DnaJ domain containing protein [Pyrenophora tritici-repentis]KAI1666640.1 Chaperone protein DnaJ [Pyrenophora tritici-repentis]KAI1682467.1 Chaperone protein DnaJ [Pyrenophora tritici-repentis]
MPHPVYDGGPLDPFADYKAMLNEISGDAEGSRPSTRGPSQWYATETCVPSNLREAPISYSYFNGSSRNSRSSSQYRTEERYTHTSSSSQPPPPQPRRTYTARPRTPSYSSSSYSSSSSSEQNDHYTRSRAHSPPPSPPLQGTKPRNDLYAVLGLSRSATATKIKKAHRAMSLKWHPDRCGEGMKNKATEMMAEINHANDVLGDEKKRAYHDRTGLMASDL